jgi:hypothetical protein
MVVRPQCVGRNPAAHRCAPVDVGYRGSGIGIAEADDRAQARIDAARVKPPLGIAAEPAHFALSSLGEPSFEKLLAIIQAPERSKANQDEALLLRCGRHNLFELSHQKKRMLPPIIWAPDIIAQLRPPRSRSWRAQIELASFRYFGLPGNTLPFA